LAGELTAGSTYKISDEHVQLIQHPRTLIYERPDSEGVWIVGGHTGEAALQLEADEQRSGAEVEPAFTFQYRKQPFRSAGYSSAPLSNVIRAQVFFFETGRASACQGIVLEYRDGSKRALGQCRLGIDVSEECADPTQLCYNNLSKNTVLVKFYSNGSAHPRHEESGWTCCSMRGVLEFWYSERDAELNWKE
jgi:hypothetical protein